MKFKYVTVFSTIFLLIVSISVFSVHKVDAASTLTLWASGGTPTTLTLSWGESGDSLFSNYQLYFSSTGTNGPWTQIWSSTNKSETSTYVGNLSPNLNYWFYINDTDWLGNANSLTLQASTTANPQITVTAQTTTTASLSWTDNSGYSPLVPFNSYTVQMSTSGSSGPWSTVSTITDHEQSTYAVTGLGPGVYHLRMYSTAGTAYTAYSNVVAVSIVEATITANSPTTVEVKHTVQFNASPRGGSGTFNYQWYSNGSPIAGATSSSLSFTPTTPGTYIISLIAHDASYPSAEATSNPIPVKVKSPPLEISISSSTTSIQAGQQIQFTASATGGTGNYLYQWFLNGVPASSTSQIFDPNPTQPGTYSIRATVNDAQDTTLAEAGSNIITVEVSTPPPTTQPTNTSPTSNPTQTTPAPSSPPDSGFPMTYILVFVIAVVAVAAGSALLFARKRRVNPPPP